MPEDTPGTPAERPALDPWGSSGWAGADETPGWWGASAPPPQPPVAPPAERVRMAWQGRASTDYIFDFWTALGWTVLTLGIYGFYVFYQLVRRMRDHNARRLDLLDASIAFAWEQAGRRGLQEELTPSFQRAAVHIATLRRQTTEFRDPVIWTLLSVIGSGVIHVIAFILLDQDLVHHDHAEGGVEYELALIYGRLGQPLAFPDPRRLKRPHNYVGRVVASIFSFGIYLLWWFYDMMDDGNRHFFTNWAQEDSLVAAVQALQ